MANINAANGMAPVASVVGGPWNQQATLYRIPSTDTNQYGIGDIVLSLAGADVNGVPNIIKATATDIPRGVIVGIDPTLTAGTSLQGTSLSLESIPIPATKTKDYYVYVVDDPNVIFEIQGNGTATAAASINKNASPVIANPASGSPFSGTQLDTSTLATTSTLMLKVIGLAGRPGLDFTANAKFLVKFNRHEFFGSQAGV